MYGPIFFGPPKPPKVGTHYRKLGETMSWEVVKADHDEVKLSGPGPCRGYMIVSLEFFAKNYGRV